MSGFGVRNAYGSLKRVLMHRPGPELGLVNAKNLAEFNYTRPVDASALRRRLRHHAPGLSRATASRPCCCARCSRGTTTRSASSTTVPT